MIEYTLQRIASRKESTAGVLHRVGVKDIYAPPESRSRFVGFVVEDQFRTVKVAGETRVPAGRYELKLRREGGMHERYASKYTWHRGMLWLQNVPGFEWVYIHTGNKESETDGCLLTGDGLTQTAGGEFETIGSVAAYQRLYIEITGAMERGEQAFINIVDLG